MTLRGRLTLSYAIVVAIVLALVALLACRIAFEFMAHSTFDALSRSVVRAENAASAKPILDDGQTVSRVLAAAQGGGVIAFSPDGEDAFARRLHRAQRNRVAGPEANRPLPGPAGEPGAGGPPPDGIFHAGSASANLGGPPARPPIDNRAPDWSHGGPRAGADGTAAFIRLAVAPFLGLNPRHVTVRGFQVIIVPNFVELEPLVGEFGWLFLCSLILSIVIAWALASWLAHQAIAPLIVLTRQLERFSAGDFAPRPITTSEGSELGALVAAYNGAAAQVSSAFDERREVEQHMRRFIADAGHELRTPLTVIGGYLEILRKGGVDDPSVRERAFTTLTAEAQRMRTLIDRLVALARLERPDVSQLERVSVSDVATAAIAHVRAARGGEIELLCPDPLSVFADPAELAEAIENVVDNAVKYGRHSAVRVRVESAGGEAVIRVSDSGPGIPAGESGRLFERFFRGDERGDIEGSGLGLAIADRAIARCGGRIELEDGSPGRTTFTLRVPLATVRGGSDPLHI